MTKQNYQNVFTGDLIVQPGEVCEFNYRKITGSVHVGENGELN